jgi:pilus assembly protein CpaF
MPSPLEEIERHVTARATRATLDVDETGGERALRALIDEVIDEWSDDHRRGQRDHALADPAAVAERAFRNLARYGPLTDLLEDDDVWEIMVNAPDEIFVRRHSGGSRFHDEVFHDDEHVARTLTKLLEDAATSHRNLDPTEGLQDAQLDDGARVHIVHGDLSRGNHLMLNIRKFTGVAISTLDQLVARGTTSPAAARFLTAAVRSRLSIVFAGAPGAGKTTLMSCCAAELDPSLRVVIAEEVFEADVPLANVASMQTRPGRPDRAEVDLRRLVAGFLRMAPDVAIVGEVRDREALPGSRYRRLRSARSGESAECGPVSRRPAACPSTRLATGLEAAPPATGGWGCCCWRSIRRRSCWGVATRMVVAGSSGR